MTEIKAKNCEAEVLMNENEKLAVRKDTPAAEARCHLDNAGSALMPKPVLTSIRQHLDREEQLGGYVAQEQQSATLSGVYTSIAKLLNCDSTDIALTASAVDAWTKAFYSIPMAAGDNIVTSYNEYCSNFVAYLHRAKNEGLHIRVARMLEGGGLDLSHLESLIDERTKLISLVHIPSSSGEIVPAQAVGDIAQRHKIPFLLDTCQSIGQVPVDVKEIGCDMATATGRKFLRGPRGIGFLYINQKMREKLDPIVVTNQAATWIEANEYELRSDAQVFEGWERNIANQLGLGAAVDYFLTLGVKKTTGHTLAMASGLRKNLSAMKDIVMTCPQNSEAAIITFNKDGLDAATVKAKLEQQDIVVQITNVVHTRLDLEARGIETAVRVSPHYYNSGADFDRFLNALEGL